MAYVGNQYDRDEAFDSFFAPAAARFPHQVAGKWIDTSRWPGVNFSGRCPYPQTRATYLTAVTTILLNPGRYSRVGHISQRLYEAVLAGCLPLTPTTLACADVYTPRALHVADGPETIARIAWAQRITGNHEHAQLIEACLSLLQPFRLSAWARAAHRAYDGSLRRIGARLMHPPRFPGFTSAYRAVLQQLDTPEHTTASRGNRSHECLNVAFTLTDPRRRTPYLKARRPNIVFNYAEALWYLAGRDDLAMIGYYAPRLRPLSPDGFRLTGTAYGPRLFRSPGADRPSQWDRIVDLLRRDPDSKRAVMTVMRPDELIEPDNPDVACTLALQFLLRDGRLHLVATMRGNDAMIGLVCDVFSFTAHAGIHRRASRCTARHLHPSGRIDARQRT